MIFLLNRDVMNKSLLLTLFLSFVHFEIYSKNIITLNDQTIEITNNQLNLLTKNSVMFANIQAGDAQINLQATLETFNHLINYLQTRNLPALSKNRLETLGSLAADLRMNELVELVNEKRAKLQKKPRGEEEQPKSPKKQKKEEVPLFILEVPTDEKIKTVILKISRNSGTIKNVYELSGKEDITIDDLEPIPLQLTQVKFDALVDFVTDLDLTNADQIRKKIGALTHTQKATLMLVADYLEMQPLLDITINAMVDVMVDVLSETNFIKNLYVNKNTWAAFINFSAQFPLNLIHKIAQEISFSQTNLAGFASSIRSLIVNPEGTAVYFFYHNSKSVIVEWDLTKTEAEEQTSHSKTIDDIVGSIALSPDGLKLIASIPNKSMVYDNKLEQTIRTISNLTLFENMCISSDSKYLYAISESFCLLIQLADYSPIAAIANYREDPTKKIAAIACHPLFPDQFALGINNKVNLYKIDYTSKAIKSKLIHSFIPHPQANPQDPSLYIKSIAFSKDGKHLIIGSGKEITIWDIPSGIQKNTLTGHIGTISSVSVSYDNSFIASIAQTDKSIIIWNLNDGKKLLTLPTRNVPTSIYFNPRSLGLVVGEDKGKLSYYFLNKFPLKFAKELSMDQLILYLIIKQGNLTKNQNLPTHLEETFKSFSNEMKQNIWQ